MEVLVVKMPARWLGLCVPNGPAKSQNKCTVVAALRSGWVGLTRISFFFYFYFYSIVILSVGFSPSRCERRAADVPRLPFTWHGSAIGHKGKCKNAPAAAQ